MIQEWYTCGDCGGIFPKTATDEEVEAEAQELWPGIDTSDPEEVDLLCEGCFQRIMVRVRAEAPQAIGPGWKEWRDSHGWRQ